MKIKSLAELKETAENWNGNEHEFSEMVAAFVKLKKENKEKMATEFSSASNAIPRWINGTATPHNKTQQLIISWILKEIK